ncbi:xylulokinase [Leptotrichia sp. OH3620_COT-345]|uniref:xylulokinase n=1 Tax=Leptotrichia sp. OH3620_COT-345 TaxID=2491048 RepID=UPI000F64AE81|nr:xylulokinase [Leptotrichia sp. OH3620_COT-345]RRD40239.1 xylulokinase [Leptotrichia sp. OH3620_COT-345]
MSYVIGIDLGTSSVKGIVVDKNGEILSVKSKNYSLIQKKSGYSEQNPTDWIENCYEVLSLLTEEIPELCEKLEAISISGQMHSLVLLDNQFKVLRNAILWNDTRNAEECNFINSNHKKKILEITKNIALEGFTLPKILWVQKNEPEIWSKVKYIMLPKDYLGYKLSGKIYTDCSDAAGTLLFNLETGYWDEKITEIFNIPKSCLPKPFYSTEIIGTVRKEIKEKYGFRNNIKLIAGGADNACSAIANGILEENVGLVSIGTSGVFLSYEKTLHNKYNGKLHFFKHCEKNSYYSMGVTLSAGYSLNWFKKTFANKVSYDDLLNDIKEINPGADGLLFSPYISGERTPYADGKIRGSFIGMDSHHSLKHFTRSVIEGITFSLKDSMELMKKLGNKNYDYIVSTGGGSKSEEWLQIQSDIFNCRIVTLQTEQGPGFGAAMVAAVGIGWFKNLKECSKTFLKYDKSFYPDIENAKKYEAVYEKYKNIYKYTKALM